MCGDRQVAGRRQMLTREQWAHLALVQWDSFLAILMAIEPRLTFDLRGDPPQFIATRQKEVREK